MSTTEWKKLPLSLAELCIETTLRCGQAFRWRKIDDAWHCALHGRVVSLKQDPEHLHYRVTFPQRAEAHADDTLDLLHGYFSLSYSLTAMYARWSAVDANFAARAPAFGGVRILNQDAWETLVAFICSSNNNIARISGMVASLCAQYGPLVAHVAGEPFHDLPTPDVLAAAPDVEARLRTLGFGYRARYVAETARTLAAVKPAGWLAGLRNPASPATPGGPAEHGAAGDEENLPSYVAAHKALLGLAGVGPKVADCVCLMGLGWGEAVPVDTHVWQIARRDYQFSAGGARNPQTLTKGIYEAVGDHFRSIWGPQAGWAQSVLFTANLKSFSDQAAATKTPEKGEATGKGKVSLEEADEGQSGRPAEVAMVAKDLTSNSEPDTRASNVFEKAPGPLIARSGAAETWAGDGRRNERDSSALGEQREGRTRAARSEMGSNSSVNEGENTAAPMKRPEKKGRIEMSRKGTDLAAEANTTEPAAIGCEVKLDENVAQDPPKTVRTTLGKRRATVKREYHSPSSCTEIGWRTSKRLRKTKETEI